MADTLAALVAAGIVYDKNDFADPHLEGPTALTVTADGRVFGHLATWGTPHIGMGSRVNPPTSQSGYKYFHQGVVSTSDGDLPVGKLTMGTGHAAVARGITADAAAAHYDNTGSVVATVRAGEDQHGIWLAGRLVPGIADERVDELRRSGVSGDWRGIGGRHELVAALAVNVPGFPIPRTEELVAAGTMALVAAGIVVPAGADLPQNVDEFNAVLAAAVAEQVEAVFAAAVDARVESALEARLGQIRDIERRRKSAVARVAAFTAAGQRRVRTQEGVDLYGVGIGEVIPEAVDDVAQQPVARMEEDQSPAEGARGGALVEYADGVAYYDDGSQTDGQSWTDTADDASAEPAANDGAEDTPDTEAAPDAYVGYEVGEPIATDVPARQDVGAGTDHLMEEDESPEAGANGGALVSYAEGMAIYDDGSMTDGERWMAADPSMVQNARDAANAAQIAASGLVLTASATRRALAAMGLTAAVRKVRTPSAWGGAPVGTPITPGMVAARRGGKKTGGSGGTSKGVDDSAGGSDPVKSPNGEATSGRSAQVAQAQSYARSQSDHSRRLDKMRQDASAANRDAEMWEQAAKVAEGNGKPEAANDARKKAEALREEAKTHEADAAPLEQKLAEAQRLSEEKKFEEAAQLLTGS